MWWKERDIKYTFWQIKKIGDKPKIEKKELTYQFSVEEPEKAEKAIVIFVQKQHFSEEISNLTNGKPIKESSHLHKLDPVMVNGILRVGSRLSRSALPEEAKHPAILPKSSNIWAHSPLHSWESWRLSSFSWWFCPQKFMVYGPHDWQLKMLKGLCIKYMLRHKPVNWKGLLLSYVFCLRLNKFDNPYWYEYDV